MSKDKGKKATSSDEFGKPSEAKGGGDGFRFESDENLGVLFLITPLRTKEVEGFEGKEAEVIVADIVALNEKKPEKSEEHDEAYIWGGWTKGAIRGYIGERRVLGRLAQDKSKGRGKNAAWVLEDADADDVEVAKAYLASLDAFAVKGGKGGDEKSSKKKSKK